MISNQIIQTTIDKINAVSNMGLSVYDGFGAKIADVGDTVDYTKAVVLDFAESSADSLEIGGGMLFKICDEGDCLYMLAVFGGEDKYLVGKLAAGQLEGLVTAYKDKVDRNSFFQNLLLDNLLIVDIYNSAQKLHIDAVLQ